MWLRDPSNGGFESLSHRYFRELNVTPQPPSRARTDAFENLRQRFLRELNVTPQVTVLTFTIATFSVAEALEATENVAIEATENVALEATDLISCLREPQSTGNNEFHKKKT